MGHTFSLLTAALLVAQAPESPVYMQQTTTVQRSSCSCPSNGSGWQKTWTSTQYTTTQQAQPGWWSRFTGWFTGNRTAQPTRVRPVPQEYTQPMTTPVYSAEPPLAEPPTTQPPSKQPPIQVQVVSPTSYDVPAALPRSAINSRFVDKIGHEEDYTWVTGQLFKENNRWVIRYATPETVDRFHGAFQLAPEGSMSNVQTGDLVSVRGRVVSGGQGGMAIYQASSVDVIERSEK